MNEIDRILDSIPPHEQLATDINMLVASYISELVSKSSLERIAIALEVTPYRLREMMTGTYNFDVITISKVIYLISEEARLGILSDILDTVEKEITKIDPLYLIHRAIKKL